jgi:hypothetical protein
MDGLCACGCENRTSISKQNRAPLGHLKGKPVKYIRGHHMRGRRANGWKGGRKIDRAGYVMLYRPEHPLANGSGYIYEHRLAWMQANGRPLTSSERVHHIDGNRANNDPANLVVMDRVAHLVFHGGSEPTRLKKSAANRRRYRNPKEREKARQVALRGWKTRRAR